MRFTRGATVFLAGVALAGLALAGCSSSDSGSSNGVNKPAQGGDNRGGGEISPQTSADRPSTFALDVDTASYTYALQQLKDGRWPDASNPRPEEFVNAFDMDYPQPAGDGFTVNVDGSAMPSAHHEDEVDRVRLMRVGLQTRADTGGTRPDVALTFVIDVSGSMSETGKLDLVQDALHYLARQLRPTDSVALVTFNDRATVRLNMTPVSRLEDLDKGIDSLHAGGSTNLESGLTTGYEVARDGFRPQASNRVIVLSDGLANVGDTEADPILRKVRAEADKEITLLGVGVGSDYGDSLMERLADKGDGFVVYVGNRAQARDVFVHRLPANVSVRAMDAKAQVTFTSAVESYRLVGYEDRKLAASDFRNDTVDGGEVGPGHSVTALYVVRLADGVAAGDTIARVQVRWQDPKTHEAAEQGSTVLARQLSGSFAAADPHLRLAYAAGYFAELLRRSPYGNEIALARLQEIAGGVADELNDRQVDELVDGMRLAARNGS
ncbi:vWA domain-containing protein [Hamadaea tsunoensis]|uniref:vWA domain-containing protein n=1 Tax=Hamadaea tsunoensis TaxID=53368 RepID=UPI0004040171|nr:von Willebrand factor type A domain-containing protein [Hamadaea tsunoensis]